MQKGQFPAAYLAILSTTLAISSILLIEQISVRLGHEPPFPEAYISKCAQHYPEFIIFRIGTISAGVGMILAAFINYFWLMQVSHDSSYNLHRYHPGFTVVLSTTAICFLFGSTATIDTGIMNEHIHGTCASIFFVLMIVSQFYNTVVSWVMYQNRRVKMSGVSMAVKVVLCGLYILQLWVGTTGDCWGQMYRGEVGSKNIFLEYTLALSVLGYTFVMGYDVRGYRMVYRMAGLHSPNYRRAGPKPIPIDSQQ